MKRAALLFLLVSSYLAAADKPVVPSGFPFGSLAIVSCVKVKGLERSQCIAMGAQEWADIELVKNEVRGAVSLIGLLASNPEDGRKVMEAASYLNFPELDGFDKNATGWCVCSSSVQKDQLDPFALEGLKATGKGRCQDLMVCTVKGVPGAAKP
jgi:hypothetical protein